MAPVPQFYGEPGAPIDIALDPRSIAPAWFAHRARLTAWLAALPGAAWDGPTRCDAWSIAGIVRHLASVAEFEGYTLHKAANGEPTCLLEGFDTQVLPGATASLLEGQSPAELLDTLRTNDARIEHTVAGWSVADWARTAEAPPGHVPAWLSLAHMLFDSWVHEHDLLDPRDEIPPVVPDEVRIVVAYVLGLAGFVTGIFNGLGASADLIVTDAEVRVGLDAHGDRAIVRFDWAPDGAPVVEGTAAAILDAATGRAGPEMVHGDAAGVAVLSDFSQMLR